MKARSRLTHLKALEAESIQIFREVAAEFDARSDKHILRISRLHHGNVKSSVISADFVHGADYAALAEAWARSQPTTDGAVSR